MPRRPPARRALVATLAIALLVAPAAAATAAELAQARERIDRTSAELAQARTAADRLGGAEREALERVERRLQRQKDALIRLESGIASRQADADVTGDPATSDSLTPPDATGGEDTGGPVVVLGDQPAAAPPPAGGTVAPTADGRRPAVTGADAALVATIDGYLASKASPLTGLGAVFVTESREEGLDPRFLVAISGAETSFGTYGPSQAIHNPFGMGPGIVYSSWSEGIGAAARNLGGDLYAGSGLFTIPAIQDRWAPHGAGNDPTGLNNNWVRNVSTYYAELGGDPSTAVFTTVSATVPPAAPEPVSASSAGAPAGAPVVVPSAPVIVPEAVLGSSGTGAAAAEAALGALGVRSVQGGQSPERGFDASGLVMWAYAEQGVAVPRGSVAQSRVGTPVEPADLGPGDAVFFSDPSGLIEHVGLYLGDGQFVNAPGSGDAVTISSLYEAHFAESYAGARRY